MSDPYRAPGAPLLTETDRRRLPVAWNPLAWVAVIAVMMAVESAWFTYVDEESPGHTARIWPFFFGLLLAWWVYSDRRARGIGMPFEFEAFVVFLWPIVLPYYLYRTRGWRGLLLGGGFWVVVPTIASLIMYLALTD